MAVAESRSSPAARPTRADAAARNRDALLAAARRVFLERGFHASSLEAIAIEAGFSKGVVYSQFDSKADLFLALLEQRQAERSAENAALASGLARRGASPQALLEMLRHWDSSDSGDRAWTLLVMEFRIHAARDAELSRRYSQLHRRTVEGLASVLETLLGGSGTGLPMPAPELAAVLLALAAGVALERATDPGAVPVEDIAGVLERVTSASQQPAGAARSTTSPGSRRAPAAATKPRKLQEEGR